MRLAAGSSSAAGVEARCRPPLRSWRVGERSRCPPGIPPVTLLADSAAFQCCMRQESRSSAEPWRGDSAPLEPPPSSSSASRDACCRRLLLVGASGAELLVLLLELSERAGGAAPARSATCEARGTPCDREGGVRDDLCAAARAPAFSRLSALWLEKKPPSSPSSWAGAPRLTPLSLLLLLLLREAAGALRGVARLPRDAAGAASAGTAPPPRLPETADPNRPELDDATKSGAGGGAGGPPRELLDAFLCVLP